LSREKKSTESRGDPKKTTALAFVHGGKGFLSSRQRTHLHNNPTRDPTWEMEVGLYAALSRGTVIVCRLCSILIFSRILGRGSFDTRLRARAHAWATRGTTHLLAPDTSWPHKTPGPTQLVAQHHSCEGWWLTTLTELSRLPSVNRGQASFSEPGGGVLPGPTQGGVGGTPTKGRVPG